MSASNSTHQDRPPRGLFSRFSRATADRAGSPWAFFSAIVIILIWLVSGPAFHYSDTWQLIINTGTTIITFLMVFLIQNTQNRDSKELHLKIDELIRAKLQARNEMLCLEDLNEKELRQLHEKYVAMGAGSQQDAETL